MRLRKVILHVNKFHLTVVLDGTRVVALYPTKNKELIYFVTHGRIT